MTEFRSLSGPLPIIPDDLTIPQFIFDTQGVTRPVRPHAVPWLIEDHSGRGIRQAEVGTRVVHLRLSLTEPL